MIDEAHIQRMVAMQIEQKVTDLCERIFLCRERAKNPDVWPGAKHRLQTLYYELHVWKQLLYTLEY